MANLENLMLFELRNGAYWFSEDERLDFEGDYHFEMNYKIKDLLYLEQSPIQNIMIADTYTFGKTLILDGGIQTTVNDGFIYNEMMAHVPLTIHPHAKRVCVIGGGDCGVVSEVTKYANVEQIYHVEIDPAVIKACKKYLPEIASHMEDERIVSVFQDASEFVKNPPHQFDVVIVDAADPMGPAKTLFSPEFFQNIHNSLRDDGLMIIQNHPIYFHHKIALQVFHDISHFFPITKLCTAVVPSYPGSLQGFVLGSKKYDQQMVKEFTKDTKYITRDVLESCFAIPGNLRDFAPIVKN